MSACKDVINRSRYHTARREQFSQSDAPLLQVGGGPEGGNLVKVNPTIGVKLLKGKNDKDGFHTWTNEEITRFEKRWPVGARQRLALDLLLYTGLARGDVVRLGRQHVANGVITFRMEKGRGDGVVYPPVLPILAATIAASKMGDLTSLVTERGTPFVQERFAN